MNFVLNMCLFFIYLQLLRGFLPSLCPRYGQLHQLSLQSDYFKQLEVQYKVLVVKYTQLHRYSPKLSTLAEVNVFNNPFVNAMLLFHTSVSAGV